MTLGKAMAKGMMANILNQIRSRRDLPRIESPRRKKTAEGGCGVIGIACNEQIAGKHLLQSLMQMRNRGNGKGGGVAIVGMDAGELGVAQSTLDSCYMLSIAYLDPSARSEVERSHIAPGLDLQDTIEFHPLPLKSLETPAPLVVSYFVRVKAHILDKYMDEYELDEQRADAAEDEYIYQNSYRLNTAFYASLGEKRAFVLSHGKDLLVFKLVSFGQEVVQAYQLEELHAHVWIGHHRYPTKGRVWHPGGAHPFVGLHEALVHNGDFANYAAVCEYLSQHNVHPLFLTDTEVSVLMFDLLHRTFQYPMEYVIEAMAPTTERDFTLLPPEKQAIYKELQAAHIHGSPDGPWFFLIAQSRPRLSERPEPRLIGITDTSMLRPQVFALQESGEGGPSVGLAASEKQAIDAALLSLSKEDSRFWRRADRYWNARGGSHTDGGAFNFRVLRSEGHATQLTCTDKFGRQIQGKEQVAPYSFATDPFNVTFSETVSFASVTPETFFQEFTESLVEATYEQVKSRLLFLLEDLHLDEKREWFLQAIRLLMDRRYSTANLRRSSLLSFYDLFLEQWVDSIRKSPSETFRYHDRHGLASGLGQASHKVILDARGFEPDGPNSLALELRRLVELGFRNLIVVNTRGHRFIGNGLGPGTHGIAIEVFGSPGDYLGSGIDGLTLISHAHGQDQLAQIMKEGKLVVHGDVGQTFMYGAKGGKAFILGSAAGRPLINAVGKPQVVINGTCLDYLAESFMAGDPLNGGGFVILNGMKFDEQGKWVPYATPYPGGNLFSLASGGGIFLRDPYRRVTEDQLNGGTFAPMTAEYWNLILPLLKENESHFDIPLDILLRVDGEERDPLSIYRLILPATHSALQPEEAWVRQKISA
jgi:glutamate synthase domain-containing protein 1/glutamate synthase domain-containing protein 3